VSGAVAGLVDITPASGYDSLDAFGVHAAGTVGAFLTGVFASTAVNAAAADGLLRGNPKQLVNQIVAVLVTWVFAGVMLPILSRS
jgi:ammonium transporter, Amt family